MISSTEPQVSATGRYTIIQAAKALGVTRQTLLMWVKGGAISCHENHAGRKIFRGSDITKCWRTYFV